MSSSVTKFIKTISKTYDLDEAELKAIWKGLGSTKKRDKPSTITKPFLKWVGGKTQILDEIAARFPSDINDYHEVFVGGGSVLLMLLSRMKAGQITVRGKIHAYDLNMGLIWAYKNIQANPEGVFEYINSIVTEYSSIPYEGGDINREATTIEEARQNKENYYYWMREKYKGIKDKTSLENSAIFIFLNKTCFRGVYREGPNGFNVPFGHYKTNDFASLSHLKEVSELIADVEFECTDFEHVLTNKNFSSRDFVYLDPPYVPIKDNSFVSYNEGGFNSEKHEKLFKLTVNIPSFLMSNSKTERVVNAFPQEEFTVENIICRRSINCRSVKKSDSDNVSPPEITAVEVLVTRK